jgi:GDP-D-mannose 3',5'-epimerase
MKALVAGAGGFIGGHLVNRLHAEGFEVRAVDIKPRAEWFQIQETVENLELDLREKSSAMIAATDVDVVFNLAADMGGMGFIENNKALCMISSLINTHLLLAAKEAGVKRYFFASSACVYSSWHQSIDDLSVSLSEPDAYPADPEDGYGWEKLFSERMCRHFSEDFGLDVRIARFHNVYGPFGTWTGGREKAPAAACRKVIEASFRDQAEIEIWGDGNQVRSFTYVDDCIEGIMRLCDSNYQQPINIGSAQSVTIKRLYELCQEIAGIDNVKYTFAVDAPQGVRGRSSNNALIRETLRWEPTTALEDGIAITYAWIKQQFLESIEAGD